MSNALTSILDVRFYATDAGTEPVRNWLRLLSDDVRKIIGNDIKTVQFGWPIGMPLVRHIEPGLWEIRINIPDAIARILFTTAGPVMILLNGFIKKTQKTPKQEIALARKRMKEVRNG